MKLKFVLVSLFCVLWFSVVHAQSVTQTNNVTQLGKLLALTSSWDAYSVWCNNIGSAANPTVCQSPVVNTLGLMTESSAISIDGTVVFKYPASDTTSLAVGRSALSGQADIDKYNTAIGHNAASTIIGTSNTAVGFGAMRYTATGIGNVAVGSDALRTTATSTAYYNTVVGQGAGYIINGGNNNTILGYKVGSTTLVSGDNNILIGTSTFADTSAADTSNTLKICGSAGCPITATGMDTANPPVTMAGTLTSNGYAVASGKEYPVLARHHISGNSYMAGAYALSHTLTNTATTPSDTAFASFTQNAESFAITAMGFKTSSSNASSGASVIFCLWNIGSDGKPSTLLGQTASALVTDSATGSLVSANFASPVTVPAGPFYAGGVFTTTSVEVRTSISDATGALSSTYGATSLSNAMSSTPIGGYTSSAAFSGGCPNPFGTATSVGRSAIPVFGYTVQ